VIFAELVWLEKSGLVKSSACSVLLKLRNSDHPIRKNAAGYLLQHVRGQLVKVGW
jgi:hypothetical protein